ncbi:MAG TPA: hypothetical protein VFL90_13325 [Methylomirabilota bacterium]|nr:hypothetical protein [Methylomirabilota bacterium]
MATDRRLRGTIRLKLEAKLLPREQSGRLWAGPGNNEVCSVCDEKVTKKQTVYEWEYAGGKVHMHIACYEEWNKVCGR